MAKARTEIRVGDVLGEKYRIEKAIGHGGMGLVFAARHIELRQKVAIKLLPDEHVKDADLVARFMREARAAAKLKSEHAVRVIDVGKRRSGAPFIMMELLEGEDLSDVVARGPLPISEAVDYVLQACEAIAEAHALGIVHRDIKPRNLFLSRRLGGRSFVKVLDFGLAKKISMSDVSLTATTAVIGSPQYMSPEQMRASRNVDFRTDIWSLGVCLYELISGRLPFDAEALAVVCASVLKDPHPPLATLRADVPPALSAVVDACLAKEPLDRYTTVSELAAALEPFAPPHAKGAGQRIATVLANVDGTRGDDLDPRTTATTATFDSDPRVGSPANRFILATVGAVLVLSVTGALLLFLRASSAPSRAMGVPSRYVPDEQSFVWERPALASVRTKTVAPPSSSVATPAVHGKTATATSKVQPTASASASSSKLGPSERF